MIKKEVAKATDEIAAFEPASDFSPPFFSKLHLKVGCGNLIMNLFPLVY